MKFKIDENLPAEATELLIAEGHDAITVLDEQLGGASDKELANICRREQRVMVTLDLDFADVRTYPPQDHAGIMVLRLRRQDKHQVVDTLERTVKLVEEEAVIGKLWIVEENRVRIRE